ncbi:MAG: nucleotide exchange factor GrpE [Kiritimatiellia bacterium]
MTRKKHHEHHEPPATDASTPAEATENPTAEPAATAVPFPAHPPPIPPPPPGLSPAEMELAVLKDKHLRLMADFDNFRKRQAREREDHARRNTEMLMEALLPPLDHLDLALASTPDKANPLATGVQMVSEQFKSALARFDVKPFSAKGERFDPTRHEAVSEQPSADVPAQHVLHQLRCGYQLGTRLLRPAQVVISSGPAAAPATPVCDAGEEKASIT